MCEGGGLLARRPWARLHIAVTLAVVIASVSQSEAELSSLSPSSSPMLGRAAVVVAIGPVKGQAAVDIPFSEATVAAVRG